MLTKRRRSPSSTSRSLRPGWFDSRSSMRALRLPPLASTDFWSPVYGRRIVGIRTSTAIWVSLMLGSLVCVLWGVVGQCVDDGDLFLGPLAVDDPIRPELHRPVVIPVVARADEHVVRVRLHGQADVGAARVGLRRGVRVIDDHGHLVAV